MIRLPTFNSATGHDLVAEFDAALDGLRDTPGLIIDLRGNGGGSTAVADPMAGRLLERPFVYGHEYYRSRLPFRGWRLWIDYRVAPRPPVYTHPVVVLIDVGNASTAENWLAAMVDSGRVRTVGRTTAGSSGNPLRWSAPASAFSGSMRRPR